MSRQRGQLVHHRQKLEAQGRSLLISHALPSPAHWWKEQTFCRLCRHLPAWMVSRLQMARPALLSLQEQIDTLTSELETSAPSLMPRGVGKLTSVVLTREICDWHRFNNRRAMSSYTGLCPGERTSGSKRIPGSVTKLATGRVRPTADAGIRGCAQRWWNAPGEWYASNCAIRRRKNAWPYWPRVHAPSAPCARKLS